MIVLKRELKRLDSQLHLKQKQEPQMSFLFTEEKLEYLNRQGGSGDTWGGVTQQVIPVGKTVGRK